MAGLTSAASFIALLDEEQAELKYFALEKLNNLVDEFWPEVASDIQKVYVHHTIHSTFNTSNTLYKVRNCMKMNHSPVESLLHLLHLRYTSRSDHIQYSHNNY